MSIDPLEWLPGVPGKMVESRYAAAPGAELKKGKLRSPQSSSALVANAFGWFIERPSLLPPLPHLGALEVSTVQIEVEMRFPWRGGLHPWLDAIVEGQGKLIGIESKRFEPFGGGSHFQPFSSAYSRPVWGNAMSGYQHVRDKLAAGALQFDYLNAGQLVRHALGLLNQSGRRELQPVLYYAFSEPAHWPDGMAIDRDALAAHRAEIHRFSSMVAGDQVRFVYASYSEILETWRSANDDDVRRHAYAVWNRFTPCNALDAVHP